jgi:hypothetical protein
VVVSVVSNQVVLSITPLSGVVNSTQFTVSGTGATPNGGVTATAIFPDQSLHTFQTTANASGAYSFPPFTEAQVGAYTEVASDNTSGNQSNSITFRVTPSGIAPNSSIAPPSGKLNATTFTRTGVGFTPTGGITQNVTYPNGGLTVYSVTADANGNYSTSFVLTSQAGNYSAFDVDNTTQTKSNTITWVVTPNPQGTVNPTTGTANSTEYTITGSGATENGQVTNNETYPDGIVHPYTVTANALGSFQFGPFQATEVGNYRSVITDNASGAQSSAITWSASAAINPVVAISPTSGKLNVTTFTRTDTGFTPNGGITQNVTYPNGVLTVYTATADANGNSSSSFVLTAQAGNYSAYDVDNTTQTKSNTITYVVTPNPQGTVSPTTGTVNSTQYTITGSGATENGVVTNSETFPDGTLHTFTVTANGLGGFQFGPFTEPQAGSYRTVITDNASGAQSSAITWSAN